MAGVKHGGARSANHMRWYRKSDDAEVIRVVVPKGYGKSYWAVRSSDFNYEPIELKDCYKK